jgi:hypothetical protein
MSAIVFPEQTLHGPYPLTHDDIHAVVLEGVPGVYVLGTANSETNLTPEYVGRDDSDLRRRLLRWAGEAPSSHFLFKHVTSPEEGYEEESRLYHQHEPGRNKIHPASPEGHELTCRHCPPIEAAGADRRPR